MSKQVSEQFKELSKKVKQQDLKLSINNGELTVQEIHLMPANIFNAIPLYKLCARKQVVAKELVYSFDGELFKTIMQQVEITVKNASEIKGKNVIFEYGLLVGNEFEYVNMGEYYIKDVEDDKNKEELVVTGYDKMLNFMVAFKQSDLKVTYPCTLKQLLTKMCEVCGVELYSADFYNADLTILEDFFTIQQLTYRDVLEKIAQTTETTMFIKDDKLYLCKIGDVVQELDTSYLSELVIGEKFGPVNALVLGRGAVEDNIEAKDQESINNSGRCEIRFDENEFLDTRREELIDNMLEQIKGLEYHACEASNLGLMWLEPCDVIEAKDREGSPYKTIYLSARVTINTGISGEMEAKIPEVSTTEHKVTTKEQKKALKTERMALKHEGIIRDLVEEQTETSKKLTQHEQTIDTITNKVEQIEDVTNTVEGIKTIALGNCMEGELLELHIYGNNTVFDYLYPADNLYPSDDLYPYGDSRIVVNDKVYELGVTEVLRQNAEVCDEFVLENGQAKIIRRVNKSGSTKAKEKVEDLGELKILLQEGTNTITIKNYTAKLSARFAIKNSLTNVYATKVEMNSSITQTANEINMEVRKKVDENEVISKINQSAEAVGIEANKIELSANDILNLLSGNAINLGGKKITIKSDNFNVDEKGNMTCNKGTLKNVNIEGGDIKLYPTDNLKGIRIFKASSPDDTRYMTYVVNGAIGCNDGENNAGITPSSIGVGLSTMYSDHITTPILNQTSLENQKKNFEKLQNGLNIINNTEIYKYNLKSQNDEDKKHIGFVIGKDYKYSSEITAIDSEGKEVGVDTYSMISVAYKAIQELTEKNKLLEKRVEELEANK